MVVENDASHVPPENIRTLLHFLTQAIDDRMALMREGTRYAQVRQSDVRVFVNASRGPRTIPEIARTLNISRQAVHASVQRLEALGVIALEPVTYNHRDKNVVLTARGEHARATAAEQIGLLEAELAEAIGRDSFETLRGWLARMLAAANAKIAGEGGQSRGLRAADRDADGETVA
jgi:DNA-binding MarR family transcriptional regulator